MIWFRYKFLLLLLCPHTFLLQILVLDTGFVPFTNSILGCAGSWYIDQSMVKSYKKKIDRIVVDNSVNITCSIKFNIAHLCSPQK